MSEAYDYEGFGYLPESGKTIPIKARGEFYQNPRFEDLPALLKSIAINGVKEGESDWLYTFTFEAPDSGPTHFTFKPHYERRKFRRYRRR